MMETPLQLNSITAYVKAYQKKSVTYGYLYKRGDNMLDTILLALLITAIGRIICALITRKMDKDLDEFVRNFPKDTRNNSP